MGAEALVAKFPVLVAAAHYIISDDDLALLRTYVSLGGHLILGPRTAYADEEARVRIAVAPEGLSEDAGAWYEEFSNLDEPVTVTATGTELNLGPDAAGSRWIDGLQTDGAQVLATYNHPRFGDFPAVTTNASGKGRVTVVGTVPTPALATAVMDWAAPRAADQLLEGEVPTAVTVSSGSMPDGTRAFFIFNWSWDEQTVALATDAHEPATGSHHAQGGALSLAAWGCRVLIAQATPNKATPTGEDA